VRGGRRSPPTGVIDAQSVDGGDAAGLKTRKYDGGKRRDGRKRHTLTDTGGLLLEVAVTPANTHDSRAAPEVLDRVMEEPGRLLEVVCAGTSYQGEALAEAFSEHGVEVEVVRRPDGRTGFAVVARRRVVERALGWLSRARRLNRDHEQRPDHHEHMVWWA
jgi:transposase